MRVLWLDDDRSMRVCDFWSPLRKALEGQATVSTILRTIDKEEGKFCRDCVNGRKLPSLLLPSYVNTFDWVITPAMWSYLQEPWQQITAKKAIIIGDCHGPMVKNYVGRAREVGFDLFLTVYRDGCTRSHPYLPQGRVEWLPYWVDESYLHDYGCAKEFGVLSTGAKHAGVYQIRTKIREVLKDEAWFKDVERPRENMEGKYWPVGEDYAKLINSSHIAAACTSKYHYSLSKLFEIPACRTALMCDEIPEMAALGFFPMGNYLPVDLQTDIFGQTQHWLSREFRPELEQITEAGYQLMHTRHTTTVRATELLAMLEAR